jgi:hypothetical protein
VSIDPTKRSGTVLEQTGPLHGTYMLSWIEHCTDVLNIEHQDGSYKCNYLHKPGEEL